MELPSHHRRRTVQLTGSRKEYDYPHILQFYRLPPIGSISLKEFEEFAIERLQVLRAVERVGLKHVKSTNDYRDAFLAELTKQKLKGYVKKGLQNEQLTDDMYDERRKDHISHFILRLAYCRTEELRRWFISQELDLFRFRFVTESENYDSMEHFFKLNNLDYAPISGEEKSKIASELRDSSFSLSDHKVKDIKYYKVPFLEALDLVRGRKVYLNKGYVYIPRMDLVSVVLTVFRNHLSHALAVTSRALPQLEEDGRLLSMLNGLNQRYLGDDYSNSKREGQEGQVSPQMVDALAKSSFPLCMQTLHETLRQSHHLKHGGRMQYGLFLKGIGLSLEDALRFWREEFVKIIDSDK
ncbi:DNA primase large subunit-like, partial [Limulus polyphemus]|uniref:DNA primase large subunit n=1 Tax=Limulus polyphemus TaxID=6850 RepID=A0ABM1RV50_LIMPO